MRTLGVGTGPGLWEPIKYLFICTLSFFAAVKFDLTDRMVKLDWVSCVVTNIQHMSARACLYFDEFNLYVSFFSFQHMEGPECQLYGQLRLHTFASCFTEWTQVSLDLLECFIELLLTAQGSLGAQFNLNCRLWCHNVRVNLYVLCRSYCAGFFLHPGAAEKSFFYSVS